MAVEISDYTRKNLMLESPEYFRKVLDVTYGAWYRGGSRRLRQEAIFRFGSYWRRPYTYSLQGWIDNPNVKHIIRIRNRPRSYIALCGVELVGSKMVLDLCRDESVPVCKSCIRYDNQYEESILLHLRKMGGPILPPR